MPLNLSLKNLLSNIKDRITQDGRYYYWGTNDNFPNIVIDSANDSGTAMECIDKLETFISGDGIKNKTFLEQQANPAQKWGDLLTAIDRQLAYFNGITIRVIYNAAGLPARFYLLPIQNIRRRYDGNFVYGEDLGDPQGYKMFTNRKREIIPPYNKNASPQEIRQQIAEQTARYGRQVGSLLYVFIPGIGLNYQYYPVPKWTSGLNDINADAGLSLHEESQVSNSFKAGVIIQTRPLNKELKDEEGYTEYDYFQMESEKFCSPDGSPILHIETLNGESSAVVTPLNIQHQMDATEKATDRIGRKVCRLFGVPPIIAGFSTAGKLGDNQELVNNMKLFQLTLKKKWRLKETLLKELYPSLPSEGFETEPLDLFSFLPDKVLDKMTPEQINEAFELPKVESLGIEGPTAPRQAVEVNEHLKTLTGKQQQHLDRIVRKFGKEELSETQAVMQLTSGFGFTEDEAKSYLDIV